MSEPKEQDSPNATSGKGRATPSRKASQAANRKPIVGDRSPEAKKAAKTELAKQRAVARAGMAAGDERYLTPRDRGPQRKFARDYVDSRLNLGELMIPLMFVVLLLSGIENQTLQLALIAAMWLLMFVIIIDGFIIGKKLNAKLSEKFGADRVEKGIRWYAAVRSTQLRVMRLPKPQVSRRTKLK